MHARTRSHTQEGILARLDARFDGSKAPQARNTSGSQLGAAAYASPGLQPGSSAAAARSSDGSPSQPVLRRSGSNVGSGEASPAPRALHRTSSSSGTGAGSPLGLPGAGARAWAHAVCTCVQACRRVCASRMMVWRHHCAARALAGAANKPKAGAAGSSGNWLKGGGGGKANVSAALGDVLG